MQMKNIREKLKKLWRGLQREILGESNRIIVPVAVSHMPAATFMSSVSVPNPDNRLEFEDNKVLLEGEDKDIHRVRCLDAIIGKLSRSFNQKAQEKIQLHIADVADSLQRVRAYRLDGAKGSEKIAVQSLWYSKIWQDVARIKLG